MINSRSTSNKSEFCEQVLNSLSDNGERQLLMSIPIFTCLKAKQNINDYYSLKNELVEFEVLLSYKPIASAFIDSPQFLGNEYRIGSEYQSNHYLGNIFSITPLRSSDAHYFEKLYSEKQVMRDIILQKQTINGELIFCAVYYIILIFRLSFFSLLSFFFFFFSFFLLLLSVLPLLSLTILYYQ